MRIFVGGARGEPLREVPRVPAPLPEEAWTWIDLHVSERDEIERLAADHGWAHVAIEDVFDDYPVAALSDFGEHIFLVLQSLDQGSPRVSTIEVDGFLAAGSLVTIHHGAVPALETLMDTANRIPGMAAGGPDLMLVRVAAAVTSPYLRLIDQLEERIDSIEDRAIGRDPSVIGEIQALRSDVTRLRRLVAPQRDVLLSLSRDATSPLVGPSARHRFADGYEQVFRTIESLDGARMLLVAALETYRSAVAEDMNRVMKLLTVFSAVILPLTLLAGIWGMNFTNMPELDDRWGYAIALIAMASIGVGTWLWFAHLGLVGRPRMRELPRSIGIGLWEVAKRPVKGFEAVIHSHGHREPPMGDRPEP